MQFRENRKITIDFDKCTVSFGCNTVAYHDIMNKLQDQERYEDMARLRDIAIDKGIIVPMRLPEPK